MPRYETLDSIADAYVPALLLLWLGVAAIPLAGRAWRMSLTRFAFGLSVLAVCYGFMFADKALGIWEGLGLDYSTHTAASLALIAFQCVVLRRFWPLWIGSLAAYAFLMVYQRYHTWPDILTTSAAVAPLMALLCLWFADGTSLQVERRTQADAVRDGAIARA